MKTANNEDIKRVYALLREQLMKGAVKDWKKKRISSVDLRHITRFLYKK